MRENLKSFYRFLICLLPAALLLFSAGICTAADMVYALTVPYPTVSDGIALSVLKDFWKGKRPEEIDELIMSHETLEMFSQEWGKPDKKAAVKAMAEAELLPYAWERTDCFALIPFGKLDPRWKVMEVDGTSVFSRNFVPAEYALTLSLPELAVSNYDPEKLTSVTMTGTTAMSRYFAYYAETDGLLTTVENIAETLSASDITHISNEASFTESCPPGVPLRKEARFCSSPDYLSILEAIGTDVVELTGNHNLDWGYEAFRYSMKVYEEAGIRTYGGGETQAEAREPLKIEHHGNRIAFIGCNAIGPDNIWASADHPGAARCDLKTLKQQILDLKNDGWMPIVTFQHIEWPDHVVPPLESHDFLDVARDAAPVIISGSQAHIPQGMTFVGDTFIHYGLGNLLFDQMSEMERTSFFDRHYFYDGRYIGSSLETIRLENYSRQRFLDPEERAQFLEKIFGTCSWAEVFAGGNE